MKSHKSTAFLDSLSPGQIRIAFVDVQAFGNSSTTAGYEYSGASPKNGDIWIDNSRSTSNFALGSYDMEILLHELGHALGLKHPFEGTVLPREWDSRRFTVMSDNNPSDGTNLWYENVGGVPAAKAGAFISRLVHPCGTSAR